MIYILYNPLARNCKKEKSINKFKKIVKKNFKSEEISFLNILKIENPNFFLSTIKQIDKIIIAGGDGTLNAISNSIDFDKYDMDNIYLIKAGTGNDFFKSLNTNKKIVNITRYLKNLPKIKINDKEYKFLNGVGIGLDGLICHYILNLKLKKTRNVFFKSSIKAFKNHKPFDISFELDNIPYDLKNVRLISIMNSPYYGGGMKISPNSHRDNPYLDIVVISDISKKALLFNFPKVYKGKHLKLKYVKVYKANNIVIKNNSQFIQIDGESFEKEPKLTISK